MLFMDMFKCGESLNTSMGKMKKERQDSGYLSGERKNTEKEYICCIVAKI